MPPVQEADRPGAYEAHKRASREYNARASRSGRDIGELPPVADPARKARATASFRSFCEAYFPHRFTLAWSPDHVEVLARCEEAGDRGGLFALAMPRGSGKTSVCEVLCLWATFRGGR